MQHIFIIPTPLKTTFRILNNFLSPYYSTRSLPFVLLPGLVLQFIWWVEDEQVTSSDGQQFERQRVRYFRQQFMNKRHLARTSQNLLFTEENNLNKGKAGLLKLLKHTSRTTCRSAIPIVKNKYLRKQPLISPHIKIVLQKIFIRISSYIAESSLI